MKDLTVFLTHDPVALEKYYGINALKALGEIAKFRVNESYEIWNPVGLAAAAKGCNVIVSDRRAEGCSDLFELMPDLLAFCRCAVDIRNVDVKAASKYGVLVTQASAGFMNSVAEWIICVMIDLSRGISNSVAQYRSGSFPVPVMGRELCHSTIGIVGYGQIGKKLANLALSFGMQVLVNDPFVEVEGDLVQQVSIDKLLMRCDFVVCLANATAQTENLMGKKEFSLMRQSAFFINPSRGDLVDEEALLFALDTGHIAGCALDVGRGHDQMPGSLLVQHPRVIATPHIGGLTPQAIEHQSMETVRQIKDVLNGIEPVGAVNWVKASRLQNFFRN